jgi:dolichol-phosphate mannosyltransferase
MNNKIAVVIPCYKVKDHILGVISSIGEEVNSIYVVDDKCPQNTGNFVLDNNIDPRVNVIFHDENIGVGGAVLTGYIAARNDGHYCAVKVDGDGQMDPVLIPAFVAPILDGTADYTKGNRFFNPEDVKAMPVIRTIGNISLSFMQKISSGYWDLFDPTNGYTAINLHLLDLLPLDKIAKRYFFESDILFRLGTINAVVTDIPMKAIYGDEVSNLKISDIVLKFAYSHLKNTCKRILYKYYLRDFSVASIELPIGLILFMYGLVFGIISWSDSIHSAQTASSGTVMLAALPIIIGIQLLLSFLAYDIMTRPKKPIAKSMVHYAKR